ncbi:MAG: HupE/UreJ family protein [Pikeienuella sp.]
MKKLVLITPALLAPSIAWAHSAEGFGGGFSSGFAHPFMGPDHLAAMVAVGIWGSQLGMPLLVALPVAFPLMMAVGAMFGMAFGPLGVIELGVAASALALGLAVLMRWRPSSTGIAVALVAAFALFHGYAHGGELDPAANPAAYVFGFVIGTGMLHLVGVGIGEIGARSGGGEKIVRGVGALIAAAGAFFTLSAVGL